LILLCSFPAVQLMDELFVVEGNVIDSFVGQEYARRCPTMEGNMKEAMEGNLKDTSSSG
jgi:hypothetical protein